MSLGALSVLSSNYAAFIILLCLSLYRLSIFHTISLGFLHTFINSFLSNSPPPLIEPGPSISVMDAFKFQQRPSLPRKLTFDGLFFLSSIVLNLLVMLLIKLRINQNYMPKRGPTSSSSTRTSETVPFIPPPMAYRVGL